MGGSLGVRRPVNNRPLLLIGQDESSYHQFVFSKKQWKGPGGHNFILPKGLGETLMISGFWSRTFGLGLGDLLNAKMQKRINVSRRGKKYKSEVDADIVNSNANKKDLTDDPLKQYFKVGINNQRYWTSCHENL